MTKDQICIVIPIYKEKLNDFEVQSVGQCIKTLSDYVIHFICSDKLDLDFYKLRFPEIEHYIFFDSKYFQDVTGYNCLMLSPEFYKAFKKFNYMLIYQTDCFVFRDELLLWANKGYDYTGGIWFDNYHDDPSFGAKIWHAGNGGLSLRKVNKMILILTSKKPLKSLSELIKEKKQLENKRKINLLRKLSLLTNSFLGYKNNFNYFASTYNINEDVFFMEACLIFKKITTPKVEEALSFSWDKHPQFLHETYGLIPFACHAWFRDDGHYKGNREFWLDIISKNNE
ncbi:DUF5672 family protein [Gaetbulibacter sp. M235]|uniref:DUF5672 family protein n=1 Tax=Gaetbulibacter sp. M235 TaxID=3126510 RepID=UPI00374FD0C4